MFFANDPKTVSTLRPGGAARTSPLANCVFITLYTNFFPLSLRLPFKLSIRSVGCRNLEAVTALFVRTHLSTTLILLRISTNTRCPNNYCALQDGANFTFVLLLLKTFSLLCIGHFVYIF